MKLDKGIDVEAALAAYRQSPSVLYAEPDYTLRIMEEGPTRFPNDYSTDVDPMHPSLWGMHNDGQTIGSSAGTFDADGDFPEAWNYHTGSHTTIVGVIDTGVNYNHTDLATNMWLNQGEIPAGMRTSLTDTDGDSLFTFYDLNSLSNADLTADLNNNGFRDAGDLLADLRWEDGIDQDNNGYRDDLVGWNFVSNNNDPMDDNGHGSHVAGTIGAVGNNGGTRFGQDVLVGGMWAVRMIALKFLDANGSGDLSNANKAINYATAMGAHLTNNSWGGGGYSQAMFEAIQAAGDAQSLFVVAAGNSTINSDASPQYPASYNLPNVISVAATDKFDRLASFSNYGATTVDLAAPGVEITSTWLTNPANGVHDYRTLSGTSMAAPHVAAVVALVYDRFNVSLDAEWSAADIKAQVLDAVDPLATLSGKTLTGGRLNARKALTNLRTVEKAAPRITASSPSDVYNSRVSSVRLTFSEAIDVTTFTTADIISFTGPGGPQQIPVTSVNPVPGSGNKQFDVKFARQDVNGKYLMTVGSGFADIFGNAASPDTYPAAFTIEVINQLVASSEDVPAPIRNRAITITYLTIDQDLNIDDLNLQLNITHSKVSDLKISLGHPDGSTPVLLFNRRGGSGSNFNNTIFDDEATSSISSRSSIAPYTGSYKPEQSLSAFDGKSTRGTWRLIVEDLALNKHEGTINSWSLRINNPVVGSASTSSGFTQSGQTSMTIGSASLASGPEESAVDAVFGLMDDEASLLKKKKNRHVPATLG